MLFLAFGDVFACIGVREPLPNASQAFTKFGEAHRSMEKYAYDTVKKLKPMISDLNTYLTKAVPDTKLTIKKYLNAKFEYLVGYRLLYASTRRECLLLRVLRARAFVWVCYIISVPVCRATV